MKLSDTVMGGLLLVLAAAIGIYVSGFPRMPGQNYGAALFPGLIAAGLAACGALLLARGLRAKAPAFEFAPWTRAAPLAANFALVCGALLFYIFAAETLGFMATGSLLLLALFLKLGVRPLSATVVAVVAALVFHLLFYKLLRVPLPWGILQFMAGW
ncbi:MAG: tripartite tricarboxylate transporter TctB family protein [Burkholderiales bacterium]|nr:tripartite tricarboxylate transporter TctB family protein [Burkholderiales bacterium]